MNRVSHHRLNVSLFRSRLRGLSRSGSPSSAISRTT